MRDIRYIYSRQRCSELPIRDAVLLKFYTPLLECIKKILGKIYRKNSYKDGTNAFTKNKNSLRIPVLSMICYNKIQTIIILYL